MIQHSHRLSSLRICHARPGQGAAFNVNHALPGKFNKRLNELTLQIPTYEI